MTEDAADGDLPPLIEIVPEDPRWDALGMEALADRAARATLAVLRIPAQGMQASLLLCDDARIAGLNAEFRGKPQPTNVLSWPAWDLAAEEEGDDPAPPVHADPDDPEPLGDIALAWETCAREAAEQGKPVADHVTHLVVHGLLHCLGYDHERDGDAALMEGLEIRILASMGLPDPYESGAAVPGNPGKDR